MGIIESFRRWRVRREFGKYVSPELVVKAMNSQLPEPKMTHFQYILVHIRGADTNELQKLIAKVVGGFCAGHATVGSIESSLLVGYLGIPYTKYDSSEARVGLVAALLAENGNAMRIAHGECSSLVGILGSNNRFTYGAIIPDFSAVLKKLLDAEFGTAVEIASR